MVEYVVNYQYIATELCINKDKPKLKCDGKCHLKSELAKAANNDSPNSDKSKSSLAETLIFFQEIPIFQFEVNRNLFQKLQSSYSNLYTMLFSTPTFHPPSL